MIRLLNDVKGSAVRASDGDIGMVTDYYFDDQRWAIRYLVVDVGNLVRGGFVLISPIAVRGTDWENQTIDLSIDRERVRSGPTTDVLQPISRQYETDYYRYYGWPTYWAGPGIWGAEATPGALGLITPPSTTIGGTSAEPSERDVRRTVRDRTGAGLEESRLRSAKEVAGYHIKATDQEAGHIDDYVVDRDTWVIHSIVIDTSNWPGGKTVVLPRERIERVDWSTKQIFVNMTSHEVRNSPEFSEASLSRRL
ncbi:MAG: PRC-barrel domain containing protein [Acidobacteria bacterium]|nr:MAG: PRC-barrel domain containing protein [Acidobacteriota bacterium]RPJ61601.1 MAG: PRC-barrel domain containing protein [Acidobacteriota bacterium]